jgi:hypothetical protein
MVAAAVLVAQLTVAVGLDPQPRHLSMTAVMIVLVGLLLWGSRVAWVLTFLGVLFQLSSSVYSAQWRLITGATVALCLFAPSSMRYVWRTPLEQKSGWMGQRAMELYFRIRAWTHAIIHRLVGWDYGEIGMPLRQRGYSVGLWRFGLSCLVFAFLGGVTVNWRESSGGDSSFLKIAENVIWICYMFAQLVFVALLVLAAWGFVARHRPQRQRQGTDGSRTP